MDFYNALNQGVYQQAESLYGGSYDNLQYFNPDLDLMDNISLLQAGYEFNGIKCLKVLTVALMQENDPLEYVYEVSFSNPDGSLFVLGPCCGASEEDMNSDSLRSCSGSFQSIQYPRRMDCSVCTAAKGRTCALHLRTNCSNPNSSISFLDGKTHMLGIGPQSDPVTVRARVIESLH